LSVQEGACGRSPLRAGTARLNLRTTGRQKQLFETAALHRGITVTDFVLESASRRAEEILAEQGDFVLAPDRWRAFLAALDRPLRRKPRLARLLSEPSVLERKR
jgi:uncharacterized protein (DUF1778 family)